MRWILLLLFAATFAAFGWALRRYFIVAGEMPRRMRLLAISGSAYSIWQLYLLLHVETSPGWSLAAGFLCSVSLALFAGALLAARENRLHVAFTEEAPGALIQTGPFRWLRHPIYTSYLLAWLAGVVATRSIALACFWPCMALQYVAAARLEERAFMNGPRREEYAAYLERTALVRGALSPEGASGGKRHE